MLLLLFTIPKSITETCVFVLTTCDGAVKPIALETGTTLTGVGSSRVGAVGMAMTWVLHTLIHIWEKGKDLQVGGQI